MSSRSAFATCSAASSVQPPRNTDSAASSFRSSGLSSSYDHSMVERSVCCRVSASRPPRRRSRRSPRRSSSWAVERSDVRAAASSSASGRSSRRSHSSSTSSSGSKFGSAARARATKSHRASVRSRTGTGYTCSPCTRSRSRLVTRTSAQGHSARTATTSDAASTTCSKLSSRSSRRRPSTSSCNARHRRGRGQRTAPPHWDQ